MNKKDEYYSRFLSLDPRFSYLPENDLYLQARKTPVCKAAIIGTGIMGQEHIRNTMIEGRASLYGIYDQNPNSVEAAKREFRQFAPDKELMVYDSLEAACLDPETDILMICTPNYTHYDIVKEAVKSGKHILLEKPMATNIKDGYEICKLVQNYKNIFQVGLQYRYKAIYAESIKEAVEQKSIGDIKTISILEHRIPFLDKVNQWNKFSQFSGGSLVEKCCHYFDLFNLFAGAKPEKVYATGSMGVNFKSFVYNNNGKSEILDNAFVVIDYENGVRANFSLCMFAPLFYEQLIICGDKGHLMASEKENFRSGPKVKNYMEINLGDERPARIINPQYPDSVEELGHHGATFLEHIKFMDNIEGKKCNTATVDEGFWSVVIGVAAEKSVKTGNAVIIKDLLKANSIKI